MSSVVERLTNRPRRTESLTLAVDPNEATKLARLRGERDSTRGAADRATTRSAAAEDDEKLAAKADELEQAAIEAELEYDDFVAAIVTFTVDIQAVPMPEVRAVEAENPPTDKQRKAARAAANGDPKAEPINNPDTFPAAFMAKAITCITISDDPENPEVSLTAEQVADMWAAWSEADQNSLYQMAEMLAVAPTQVGDLGKG